MSLKRSLTLAFAGLLTLLSILSAVFSYVSAQNEAWDMMDAQQRQIARFVGDGSTLNIPSMPLVSEDPEDNYVIEITNKNGKSNYSSNPELQLPTKFDADFSNFQNEIGAWRVFTLVENHRIVRVAQQIAVRNEIAAESALGAALPFLFAIPLSWLITTGLVAAIIKQLTAVANKVERRAVGTTEPIEVTEVPLEARPLIDAMNNALARVETAREQQSTFLANAAHELRTPLAAIMLQIGNLKRVILEPALIERVEDVEAGAKRAAGLIDQLLRLARQDAIIRPVEFEPVALGSLISDVVSGLSSLAKARNIEININQIQAASVQGSLIDFRVLLETLVDNAVRYTPAAGKVEIVLTYGNNRPVITISDTGPGIDQEHLPRVFERFYRAASQNEPGSGLGLSIAKLVADRYKIEINLANRADRTGLEAKLIFPILQSQL